MLFLQIYEDTEAKLSSPLRFIVEIGLSPGVAGDAVENGKRTLFPIAWSRFAILCLIRCSLDWLKLNDILMSPHISGFGSMIDCACQCFRLSPQVSTN